MFSTDVAIHFILNVFFQISPDAPFVKKRYCRVLKILERVPIMLYSRQRRIWKQIIKVTNDEIGDEEDNDDSDDVEQTETKQNETTVNELLQKISLWQRPHPHDALL